jgi:hypothetical protein
MSPKNQTGKTSLNLNHQQQHSSINTVSDYEALKPFFHAAWHLLLNKSSTDDQDCS